ncbi:hypothetical protein HN014_10785 [Aquimarina sp. TRL1]|nr:hypothetical protein [Aquimarina sp. TRL1]QKX03370.1 hypothetical protein HN014_10785 [Aquimarina sp. TRL1]
MNADKGNIWINVIFGVFLTVSIAKGGISIYEWHQKRKAKKQCRCGSKKT